MMIGSPHVHDEVARIYFLIESGPLDEFLVYAKAYNIFQISNSRFYTQTCDKIRERLVRENLTENDLKE
jgi:hypothetical protein